MTIIDAGALHRALTALRRHRRRRVLLEGFVAIALMVLVVLGLGLLISEVLGGGPMATVIVRAVGWLLLAFALIWFVVKPVSQRVGDDRLALYVEERAPEIRQLLVSAVHVATDIDGLPASSLDQRVIVRALAEVDRLRAGAVIERPRVQRALSILAGVVAAGALLTWLGPTALRDVARMLFVPWSAAAEVPVRAVRVTPGDIKVARGAALDLKAESRGFVADAAELVFTANSATEAIRLTMLRDSLGSRFGIRMFDVTQSGNYYVEADGIRSPTFQITVTDLPAVKRVGVELQFPAYTGLKVEKVEDGGDIAAVKGTRVQLAIDVSLPVRNGTLHFDDGRTIPLTVGSDGSVVGGFRVERPGFYRVDLMAPDGSEVTGTVQYAVEVLPDHPPTVRISDPGRDTKATVTEELSIGVNVSDDFGVAGVDLIYAVNGGAEKRLTLADSARRGGQEFRAAHTLFLEEMGLRPGDLVAYHAEARDGAGNKASSDIYFVEIRPFGRDYKQAEQGGGGGGGGGQNASALPARQREIVAGTFNWLRDSATTSERERSENLTTLAIAQAKLNVDVAELANQLKARDAASVDSTFLVIQAELEAANKEMAESEKALTAGRARAALGAEQRALQHVQRADAAYREVQVRMGQQGGGGGGGGGGESAQDLADLFQLETDRLQNQYEAVQRQSSTARAQQVDSAAERLKQLAARLQQENHRMEQQARAMRERLGREGGGSGGGGSQRELARQVEEEARRLERLAREKNSESLGQAAQELQQSANAMRQSGAGSSAAGAAAAERLQAASRALQKSRIATAEDQVRGLAERARGLGLRQRDIAKDVAALPGAAPSDRTTRIKQLEDRKDALQSAVESLERETERLARDTRREQPASAAGLSEAVTGIRDARLPERIAYSKNVMRNGTAEYTRAFEGVIAEQLDSLTMRLQSAVGMIGSSPARKQNEAMAHARELVGSLESLRERRTEAPVQPGAGQQPGRAVGQQGQGQGQAPGRSPGQGQGQGGQPGGAIDGAPSGDASPRGSAGGGLRQLAREAGVRRGQAESLRNETTRLGVDTGDLDRAIAQLREFERAAIGGNGEGLDQLQDAIIAGLKTFEFGLVRRFSMADHPSLGAPGAIPPEYRAQVDEYFRVLGRRPQ